MAISVTKKHMEWWAHEIALTTQAGTDARNLAIQMAVRFFKDHNPRFDEERFLERLYQHAAKYKTNPPATKKNVGEKIDRTSYSAGPIAQYFWNMVMDSWQDAEAGETETIGWHGLFNGNIYGHEEAGFNELTGEEKNELFDAFGAIVRQDSQGFIFADLYDSRKELDEAWDEIVEEAEPELTIETWFERDRAHVALMRGEETVVEWWDEDVENAVNDGFLDPKDWLGSATEYAERLGLL